MAGDKLRTADQAAALLRDGDTVGLIGGGGGLLEATAVFQAVERRFLAGKGPRGLTLVHALGIGDKGSRGLNCFAHPGLVKRVVGGHWVWSPRMQALAAEEQLEAYVLPGGVITQLFREIGARRPGLFTRIGLGTVVDPRQGGGKMNASAREELVELASVGGEELLRYKPFPVHAAIVRGSFADADGNVSFDQEAADLDAFAVALAAHNCGGKVIAQVRAAVPRGSLRPRSVRIPAALVDAVVVDPGQVMAYGLAYDPTLSGERRGPAPEEPPPLLDERQVIARRAADELREGAVVNYGFGIPALVARVAASRGLGPRLHQTLEHGYHGGEPLSGPLFGWVRNAAAIIDAPSQFDLYAGGGLDLAFLGFGEIDATGSVNVSRLGGLAVGPGGFIDIAQSARKVVFCGTFEARGARLSVGGGRLRVERPGEIRKLVPRVDQITWSGPQALRAGQEALYVTERAVFRLTPEGIELTEVAPGLDLRADVLDRMGFPPLVRDPRPMAAAHFAA